MIFLGDFTKIYNFESPKSYLSNGFFKKTIFLLFFLFGFISLAQVKIGDNPKSINPYIILELESTDKAFLFPWMTFAQRNAAFDLNDAPAGLAIFNTTSNQLEVLNSPSDPLKRGSKQWLGTDESVAQTGDTPPENPSAGQLLQKTEALRNHYRIAPTPSMTVTTTANTETGEATIGNQEKALYLLQQILLRLVAVKEATK